jgi:MFS family permease
MNQGAGYTGRVALTVALGGFLMGFDASVISGVVSFIETEFALNSIQVGWAVASLTLTSTLAMMLSGPLSDRIGRRPVLVIAAVVFAISAIGSALAPNFVTLVIARMLGGYQLNIVIGLSAAYFSNYLILRLGQGDLAWAQSLGLGDAGWRWMLGVEALPAIFYFFALFSVPESPRWLVMNGRDAEAEEILTRVGGREQAQADLRAVHESIDEASGTGKLPIGELFKPAMRLVLTIGLGLGILQQITGINAVFFYAPMIFEQSGIGTDASFMQAVIVGLVNLIFTFVAIFTIAHLGRRTLLIAGLTLISTCLLMLAWSFGSATYTLDAEAAATLPPEVDRAAIQPLIGQAFESDVEFRRAYEGALGVEAYGAHGGEILKNAIAVNPMLILMCILGYVAGFAMSLGPVMWVMLSELFPNWIRGVAISFVGLVNSAVSFGVQQVFPWELENLGSATTFLFFGVFAVLGLVFTLWLVPETKGKSIEELEAMLIK